ncbi:MAG: hypothetical protein ABIN18_11630 [Pseudomonadota bacterium]
MKIQDAFGDSENLPENIREIFVWLCQDVASLRDKWDFYLGLYKDDETTALLSDCARSSFQIIEESLRADITMTICRLSDLPSTFKKKDNLSIPKLCSYFPQDESLKKNETAFLDACMPIRLLRNKQVGHNDLNTRIAPDKFPLLGISKTQIDEMIGLAESILNKIYHIYNPNSELGFGIPLHIGGAEDLINWLKKSTSML